MPTRCRCSPAGSRTRCSREMLEPNAMTLATVAADGQPVAADGAAQGFRRRAASSSTPTTTAARAASWRPTRPAALCFWWDAPAPAGADRGPGRAGRLQPRPTPTSRRGRMAAGSAPWASPQSEVIAGRAAAGGRASGELRQRIRERRAAAAALGRLPRRARAASSSGRAGPDRLHDRLRFRRSGDGWLRDRLSP